MGTPQGGTPKTPRLPTEEMQRLFNNGEYWRRMQEGEFREELISYHRCSFPELVERYPGIRGKSAYYKDRLDTKVAEVHYYVLPDDTIIPGKRPDPKKLRHEGVLYRQECANQRAERLAAEAAQRGGETVQ